jgi:hypothetical protein
MERISEEQGGDGSQMPGLASRLVAVFFSPGRLMEQLAEQPRWIGALIMGGLVVGLTMALIPVELFLGANRQIALERGAEFPELGERAIRAMRIVIPLTSVLTTTLRSSRGCTPSSSPSFSATRAGTRSTLRWSHTRG